MARNTITRNMLRAPIVLLLAVFISQSDAHCFGSMPKDCVYKGSIIANGTVTKLKDECLRCGCNGGFLSCCSIGAHITNYPSFCTVIPDGPCNQKAVMKNNHKKPCTGPISAVGR